MMDRTVCYGCEKFDECRLWLVLSETYCPDQEIETNLPDESSHPDRNFEDASSKNEGTSMRSKDRRRDGHVRRRDGHDRGLLVAVVAGGRAGSRRCGGSGECLLIEGPFEYYTLADGSTLVRDVRQARPAGRRAGEIVEATEPGEGAVTPGTGRRGTGDRPRQNVREELGISRGESTSWQARRGRGAGPRRRPRRGRGGLA